MKKILLSGFALCMGALAMGQSSTGSWEPPKMTPWQKTVIAQESVHSNAGVEQVGAELDVQTNNGTGVLGAASTVNETIIGGTTYDLQTNSAIARRIINLGNGEIVATWTRSDEMTTSWTDRGTGYNFFDGTSWGAMPTSRLETDRTGWPNPLLIGNEEVVFAHNTNQDEIAQTGRPTLGTGAWSTLGLGSVSDSEVWSRAIVGGANGTTIHMIGLTLPIALNGTTYNGLDGALLYNRSLDGGATWDMTNIQLPGMDDVNYASMGGDNYAMDIRGDVVVIVESTLGYGVTMWKSMDNGANWTKTFIVEPTIFRFEEEIHFINADFADAMYTSDGSVSVLLDGNNKVHAWFGRQLITNGTVNDGLLGFYPFVNGIDYWNEDFAEGDEPVTIAGAMDFDGDNQIGITDQSQLASYRFRGLAGFPQGGIDANGCMYVSYSAVHELLFSGSQNYNHVFVTSSCDGGCTWTRPVDVTGDAANDFSECAFPSLAREVDTKAHILFMKDFEPGYAVAGDSDPVGDNDIVYLDVDATDITSEPAFACPTFISGDTEFCPGATSTLTAFCGSAWLWSTGATTQSIVVDQTNYGMITLETTTACGTGLDTVMVMAPSGTPVINVTATKLELCPGDTSTLAVNQVTGGTYLWSTGATVSTMDVTNAGTYTVTVTNCGGTSVESVTISPPTSVGPVSISGQNTICVGTPITLAVTAVTGGNYSWSTGSAGLTTQITAAGVYTVTVTSCAPGNAIASFTVINEPSPNPVVTALDGIIEVCFGESVTLQATGGATFDWSDGSSGPNLVLTDVQNAMSYTVVSTNLCGAVSAASTSIDVTIHALPSQPIPTFTGVFFTSAANSGNQWFVDGVAVPGATDPTWIPATGEVNDGQIVTVIVTDPITGCASEASVGIEYVGLEDLVLFGENVDIFPNPNNGQFTVQFSHAASGSYTLSLTDVLGKTVANNTIQVNGNHNETLNFTELPKGVYYLTVKNNVNETTEMLIIE